ncbi:DUF2138 family protein [Escherichia coli]
MVISHKSAQNHTKSPHPAPHKACWFYQAALSPPRIDHYPTYNAAQTLLMPKLDALSQQPRYVMKLAQMEPGVAWQWLPITWQPL